MKVHVFIRRDEICFGHYSGQEINEMLKDGWRFVHQATLEKWPKPGMQTRRLNSKRQIGVNKNGLPIYK